MDVTNLRLQPSKRISALFRGLFRGKKRCLPFREVPLNSAKFREIPSNSTSLSTQVIDIQGTFSRTGLEPFPKKYFLQSTFYRAFPACLLLMILLSTDTRAAPSCDPISTFADGKSPARQIFVSVSGNDSTGDGSRDKPYQTVARALQGLRPNDAIRLLPGTYPGGISLE